MLVVFCPTSVIQCPRCLIFVNVASSDLKCKRKGCEYENNNLFLGSRKIGFESFCMQECKRSFSNIHKVNSKGIKSSDLFPVSIFHLCSIAVRTVHLSGNSYVNSLTPSMTVDNNRKQLFPQQQTDVLIRLSLYINNATYIKECFNNTQ